MTRPGGVEVAGWTVDKEIIVQSPAYPNIMRALKRQWS